MSGATSQVKVDDCAICYDGISDSQLVKVLRPCNHYFHNDCINQWLIIEKKCPMCMRNLNQTESELHFQDGLLPGNDNENLMEEFQEEDAHHI